MPFCSTCGTQLPSAQVQFCPTCGTAVSSSGQVSQFMPPPPPPAQSTPQPFPAPYPPQIQQHANVIGIYKELELMEKVTYQSSMQTEVIFVKEAAIKKVIGGERKEVPISLSKSLVYLTNQRLIFLKLFEVSAAELGTGANQLAGASGTWYEMPLSAVTGVDMRQVQLNHNDLERFVNFFGGDESLLRRPALEIVYDEKAATGRAKDYIEAMLQRGMMSKLWGRVQMVYDKIFVLGEQSVAIQPVLAERVRQKAAGR